MKKQGLKNSCFDESSCENETSLQVRNIEEISAPSDANWEEEWISATSTRNYLLNDPLLDWLKLYYPTFVHKNPSYTKDVLKAVGDRKKSNSDSFVEYIMEQGTIFESNVIRLLSSKFGKDMLVNIGGELNPRSPSKVEETLNAMMKGVPIICSGLLHNTETKTYGVPDLLIRSDWINNICKLEAIDREEKYIPALRLRDLSSDKSPNYHYIVVDIKFSTLYLKSDGIHILNCGSFPAYKSQLYIYNEALSLLQGYNPRKAYILGRKWKLTSKGEIYKGKSCFDRLGKIDYHSVDKQYIQKTESAVKWLREVRKPSSRRWKLLDIPLSRPELYPNMSNTHDYPWRNIKSKISDEIKELTSLWMVGKTHREIAHISGIYKWTDEKCTPENLGVNGKFTSRILKKILEINQDYSENSKKKILPEIITNNLKGWQTSQEIEFYVDFETINDVLTDFESLPKVEETTLIFMIGVGYIEPISKRWTYKCFCVEELTLKEEQKICREFAEYIRSESSFYEVDNPLCIHWSHAEESFWNGAIERHIDYSEKWKTEKWEWLDLLKIFKEEPIVIRGALGFGLKEISSALHKLGFIKCNWEENSCSDGRAAMISVWKANKEAKMKKDSIQNSPRVQDIIKYNEIDVKVLYEIITYLRENHTENKDEVLPEVPGTPPLILEDRKRKRSDKNSSCKRRKI